MIIINNKSDWLTQQAQISPNSHAIVSKDFTLTYTELNQKVISTSHEFRTKGIVQSSHVALLSGNSPEFVISILALWKLGAVPVPLNIRLTPGEIEKLYDLSGSSHMLIQNSLTGGFKFSHKINCLTFPFQERTNTKQEASSNFTPGSTALLMFTSGTTGGSKGVMLTFNNLFQSALGVDTIIDHQTSDRWLAGLPFYHIGGFSIFTRALLTRSSIIFTDSLKTEDIIKSIEKYEPTLASFVPTTLKKLIETGTRPNMLRAIFLGGGPIGKLLVADAVDADWPIIKVYGSTETSSMVAAVTSEELKKDFALGAKPLAGNKIVILDNDGNILPQNNKGQVAVASKSVMKGYYNNEIATSGKMKNGYYLTSDFGYIDENGYLYIEGRIDDIIISGGENINPKEIEDALLKHPDVLEAVVFKMKDDKWGEVPWAAVSYQLSVINGPAFAEATAGRELKEFLRHTLSPFKIPKQIFIVDQIPRNEMGKVNKAKLKDELNLK